MPSPSESIDADPPPSLEQWEIPQSPVRDPEATSPNEDLDREPDGAPHMVIGMTALGSVLMAMAVAFMILTGNTAAIIAAIVLVVLGVPVMVSRLRDAAERTRDRVHPSR